MADHIVAILVYVLNVSQRLDRYFTEIDEARGEASPDLYTLRCVSQGSRRQAAAPHLLLGC